ncbi:MAG TPA: ATP-binding protein [Tepidisphaeraceae bacterium]|jgi:two-component system phosphate regulon sensor histidine kinase PhoR
MLSGLFVRRLLVPYLLLLVLILAVVAVFEGVRLENGEQPGTGIFWLLLICAGIGVVYVMVLGHLYSRWEARHAAEVLRPLSPTPSANLNDLLRSSAASFNQFVAQAGKDKAQLLTILSSMSDGLIAIDPQQRVTLVNHAAEELVGGELRQAQGKPLYESISIAPMLAAVHEVMLTGQQKTIQAGAIGGRYLEITLCRLPSDRGGGMVIVIHDITESHRYEDLRKEFVANVSHELRTPLTMIKGFVETLRDGALDDRPRALNYLSTVERHSDQLANLVNDLLDLSRLDSGADITATAPLHIDAMLRRVEEIARQAAIKKGHNLVFDVAENLPVILGNADYLQRAVANLVDNAIKYTRDSGEVKVKASQAGNQIVIEVRDNGIGIPAEDLGRIFERFYRVDRSRSREMGGTGLGLSIMKHIVQNHGGSVDVASTLGSGSVFTVYLPIGKKM